ALRAIGPHTLDAALDGLDQAGDDLRGAAELIAGWGEAAVGRLTEVLGEPPGRRPDVAALALATLAPAVALPHLVAAPRRTGESSQVLGVFVRKVGAMGPAAAAAAPALRKLLRGDAGPVPARAATAAGPSMLRRLLFRSAGPSHQDEVAEALAAVTGD